ncbi:RISC-loading complex subunit tarbp2-like [Ischnura elegans]|uniref:RISC-loading complex subunit tarbp2-like n=1 Tax=Ischnura elegans TaxID=197161 RepID=UPI001ED876FB|nr:RISC-loading complex subunit tarbp2-like [Ischnura elegans]
MDTAKTPMSTLNEYMLRKGFTPQYELITDSAGHDTFFQYVVTAGNVRETGSGRSKKEAKHNAALKALETLANSDKLVRAQLLVTSGVTTKVALDKDDAASVAVSPYAEQVTENSVGALAELCAQQNLKEPEYQLVAESGPAHSKTFVILCQVLTLREQGKARTKKQAKQISAKLMIDKIREHLAMASPLISETRTVKQAEKVKFEEKNYQAAIDGYCSIKDKDGGSSAGKNVSQTLSTSHLMLQELYGPQLSILRGFALSHTPKETLEKFAEGNDLPLDYMFMKSNLGNALCAASLGTTPELVKFGEGPDKSAAEEMASVNLLHALMMMIGRCEER